MHEIIRKLINQTDEESLECLCWLLNTTGKQLEQATEQKLTEQQVIILFMLIKIPKILKKILKNTKKYKKKIIRKGSKAFVIDTALKLFEMIFFIKRTSQFIT